MSIGWNDASELIVAGSGEVYVAPVGTALPTTPIATLNAAFEGLGYHTEDGVSLSVSPTVEEFMAWQSRQAIRREMTAQEIQVSFSLQQWNETTLPLAFGGGAITPVSGGYRYDFPTDTASLAEKAMVVDCIDGSEHHRFVFERGTVTEAVETQFQRGATAVLPITFKVLGPEAGGAPGYYLTDSAAFATGS
jgi:hypothetical protein